MGCWMGRTNQKLKLLLVLRILYEKTDDTNSITMGELLRELKTYGIEAERKSIYSDIETLQLFGVDIIGENKNGVYGYHIGNRPLELVELKLLVDLVQSSRFITAKKSRELIKKLGHLGSEEEGKQLQRQVFMSERVKTMNESIYYNVDQIYEAIRKDCQIQFQYCQWNVDKRMELRREGNRYQISPWGLVWNAERYYLLGFDEGAQKIKHYRVDKMLHLSMVEIRRQGEWCFNELDMAHYTQKRFGMFDGEIEQVELEFQNDLAGVAVDRFGTDIILHKVDAGHFMVKVEVAVSEQFLGWVMGIGEGVRIVGPKRIVERMQQETRRLMKQYLNGK